jgi:hypothetical protein
VKRVLRQGEFSEAFLLRVLNAFILVGVIAVAATLVRDRLAGGGRVSLLDSNAVAVVVVSAGQTAPLDHYLATVGGRTLFKSTPKRTSRVENTAVRRTAVQVAAGYELVGVLDGATPAAIIRDRSSAQSYSVAVGDYIQDLLVVEIRSQSVVLSLEGETVELRL